MQSDTRRSRAARALLLAGGIAMAGVATASPAHAKEKDRGKVKTRPRTGGTTGVSGTQQPAFARLRHCESGGNYAINTGNGYYGAYQFSLATWRSLGYGGMPHRASPPVQDEAARRLQARSGWGQWPSCSRRLGLR